MVPRTHAGKIVWLLDIIEEHPLELARDFREKFQVSFMSIGFSVRFDEAALLVVSLLRDTSSWLHAKLAGWEYPISREWLLTADLYDLQHASKSKRKTKPYPRPFSRAKTYGGKHKNGKIRSKADLMALLRPTNVLPDKV